MPSIIGGLCNSILGSFLCNEVTSPAQAGFYGHTHLYHITSSFFIEQAVVQEVEEDCLSYKENETGEKMLDSYIDCKAVRSVKTRVALSRVCTVSCSNYSVRYNTAFKKSTANKINTNQRKKLHR